MFQEQSAQFLKQKNITVDLKRKNLYVTQINANKIPRQSSMSFSFHNGVTY